MLFKILPERYKRALANLDTKRLTEMRLRVGLPITLEYGGLVFLGENGITVDKDNAMLPTAKEIENIIFLACESSIYAFNEEIKQGFVTLNNGVRIGLCGEVVMDKERIKTIKNFSSLNIRFPHLVKNCSLNVLQYLYTRESVLNTLILAPPGAGKTTFIRDLCTHFSDRNIARNITIIDERGEICAMQNGQASLYAGEFIDVYTGGNKADNIANAIRTMSPEVIVLDEISTTKDSKALLNLVGAGVRFLATTHCANMEELSYKPILREFLEYKVVDRFVVLSNRNGQGTIEYVFDKNQVCLYYGR